MKSQLQLLLAFFSIIRSNDGASLRDQIKHIDQNQKESDGFYLDDVLGFNVNGRRFIDHYEDEGTILGVPTRVRHLPEAEDLLPGHTLLRPALGMLKSAVKFPHRDMLDGSGVYGNINNIGMTWDGTHDRVRNTGFRRSNTERHNSLVIPQSLRKLGLELEPQDESAVDFE